MAFYSKGNTTAEHLHLLLLFHQQIVIIILTDQEKFFLFRIFCFFLFRLIIHIEPLIIYPMKNCLLICGIFAVQLFSVFVMLMEYSFQGPDKNQ